MMSLALRLLVLAGIACLIVPGPHPAKGHSESWAAQFLQTVSPSQHGAAHHGKSDAFPIAFKMPDEKQSAEALKFVSHMQSPQHLAQVMQKNATQTAHRNGWDKCIRVGIHNTVGMLDTMRAKLVASEDSIK
jgi:hypothetical protein